MDSSSHPFSSLRNWVLGVRVPLGSPPFSPLESPEWPLPFRAFSRLTANLTAKVHPQLWCLRPVFGDQPRYLAEIAGITCEQCCAPREHDRGDPQILGSDADAFFRTFARKVLMFFLAGEMNNLP